MSLSDKLTSLNTTKQNMKTALTSKGCDTSSTPFTDYYTLINNLSIPKPDYYVSTTGSDSNNGKTPSTPFLTLNKALTTNYGGNNIFIKNGTYKGLNTNIGLNLNKSITIIGESSEGVIFDCENIDNFWLNTNTSGATVSLNNLTLINNGSRFVSLDSNGTKLNIDNCNFINQTNNTYYGAIFSQGKLNITNSIFINNQAAIWFNGGNEVISNVDFINNTSNLKGTLGSSTYFDGCYWGTDSPTPSTYGTLSNQYLLNVTNNKTIPNFPDRITALGYTY